MTTFNLRKHEDNSSNTSLRDYLQSLSKDELKDFEERVFHRIVRILREIQPNRRQAELSIHEEKHLAELLVQDVLDDLKVCCPKLRKTIEQLGAKSK